jgi:hypothetical protein
MHRNLPSPGKAIEVDMSVAFLFPGQGSQVPDMLHTLPDHPSITRTLVLGARVAGVIVLGSAACRTEISSVRTVLLGGGLENRLQFRSPVSVRSKAERSISCIAPFQGPSDDGHLADAPCFSGMAGVHCWSQCIRQYVSRPKDTGFQCRIANSQCLASVRSREAL